MNRKSTLFALLLLLMSYIPPSSALTVDVTEMLWDQVYHLDGVLYDTPISSSDYGVIRSVGFFFNQSYIIYATEYFNDTSGTVLHYADDGSLTGLVYDYAFTLEEGQVAWGFQFYFNASTPMVALNIMDCGLGGVGDVCTGIGTPIQTSPFPGQVPSFNGVVISSVPVPASLWLALSGLAVLFNVSRSRRN